MAIVSLFTGSVSSGVRTINTKPQITYSGTKWKYNINNNDTLGRYDSTGPARTFGPSNAYVQLSSFGDYDISSYSAKGVDPSPTTKIQSTPITSSPFFVQTGFQTMGAPCPVGWTCYGSCGPGGSCGKPQGYVTCCRTDPTPGGYSTGQNEWYRIS